MVFHPKIVQKVQKCAGNGPKKVYFIQGSRGVWFAAISRKNLQRKTFSIFCREIAIASNNKQMWIEIEGHVYLVTDVPPGRRPGTNACIKYFVLNHANLSNSILSKIEG